MPDVLQQLTTLWQERLKIARVHKKAAFQDSADECMKYYSGPVDLLWGRSGVPRTTAGLILSGDHTEIPNPSVMMRVNKAAEMVQLFGPALYPRDPNRKVTPRQYPVLPVELFGGMGNPVAEQQYLFYQQQAQAGRAVDQARALLLETYLNYTPHQLGLAANVRNAVDEALLKGMGVLWTRSFTMPSSQFTMVGSEYDSVDNLFLDPDSQKIESCQWCARMRVRPYWEVEREFGLRPDSLNGKGSFESFSSEANLSEESHAAWLKTNGQSNDLVVYYEVYSKMGLGGRLQKAAPELQAVTDRYGDYVYLAIPINLNYPLNLPPEAVASVPDGEIRQRVQWPTPYWADNGWPFTDVSFHRVPNSLWPMSHLKPAMGELKFLDWGWSHLASKVRTTSRDFVALARAAGEDLKDKILNGPDLTFLELDSGIAGGEVSRICQFLQHPPWNRDIFTVLEGVAKLFDNRTGLTELMYGESENQIRSASESEFKAGQVNIRPNDMRDVVEAAGSALAKKEAVCARWHLQPQDVQANLGPAGAAFWPQVMQTSTLDEVVHALQYRVEAGSGERPNKGQMQRATQTAMQTLAAPFFQYAGATGDVGPINTLIALFGSSLGLPADKMLLRPPPPPPMMAPTPTPAPHPAGPPR